MKKSMIKKLVVLLVVMVVAGGFAFGVDTTGNNSAGVDLEGTVATEMEIVSSATEEVTFTIDPYQGYSGDLGVNLTAKSNHFGGYNVTATSDDAFELVGDETQTAIGYTVDLGGQGSSYSQNTVSALNGDTIAFNVSVAVATDNPYESGTYTDTVTLTIATN